MEFTKVQKQLIDIAKFDDLTDQVKVGAVVYLAEYVIESWNGPHDIRALMDSVIDSLWRFEEGKDALFDDIYETYNQRVVDLEVDLRSTVLNQTIYGVFALTFYYALWVINAVNRQSGKNPRDSQEIAEMRPRRINEIARLAIQTGITNEQAVDRYFRKIVAQTFDNKAKHISRETFRKQHDLAAT